MFTLLTGGQTGVDQAAMQAAIEVGMKVAGWAPPDGRTEAGPIPEHYGLKPTPRERSELAPDVPRSLRTEWNVRDADALLVFAESPELLDRGTAWAVESARRMNKPLFVCDPRVAVAQQQLEEWLEKIACQTLNVAGPSESEAPGLGPIVYDLMTRVLAPGADASGSP